MKKFIIIIFSIILFGNSVLAEEEINNFILPQDDFDIKGHIEYDENGVVLLEEDDKNVINLSLPKSVKAEDKDIAKEIDYGAMEKYRMISQMNSSIWSDSARRAETVHKNGAYSYGVYYENGIDDGQMEYRTNFYTRYEYKKIALNAIYGQDQYTTSGNQLNFFYISPEFNLGKGLVLKDTLKTSNTGRRKNEIVLQYNPKTKKLDNNLNFEVGIGQTVYENSASYYQFKFATSFKL